MSTKRLTDVGPAGPVTVVRRAAAQPTNGPARIDAKASAPVWQATGAQQSSARPTPVLSEADRAKFAKAAADAQQAQTLARELGRQGGLTLRAGVNGTVGLLNRTFDATVGAVVNGAVDAVNAAAGTSLPKLPSTAQSLERTLDATLPKPKNATERVVQRVAEAMVSAGAVGQGAGLATRATSAVTRAVATQLSTNQGLAMASTASSTAASAIVGEAGGGPGAQLIAGLAGALAPAGAARAAVARVPSHAPAAPNVALSGTGPLKTKWNTQRMAELAEHKAEQALAAMARPDYVGPRAQSVDAVRSFMRETIPHVYRVRQVVERMGGKASTHDLVERATVERVERLAETLKREGDPGAAWLEALAARARAKGASELEVGKLSPQVAAGLGRTGPADRAAIELHRLSEHHVGGGLSRDAQLETAADVLDALLSPRSYKQGMSVEAARRVFWDMVEKGQVSFPKTPAARKMFDELVETYETLRATEWR